MHFPQAYLTTDTTFFFKYFPEPGFKNTIQKETTQCGYLTLIGEL